MARNGRDSDVVVRPLTRDDVPAAQQVTLRASDDLGRRVATRMYHGPAPTPDQLAIAQRRYSHLVDTDPGGAWAAEAGGTVVGVALALLREGLWGLSLLMVDPAWQGRGVGGRLLRAALDYGTWERGLILSSPDTRAMRNYAKAGFRLNPIMSAFGRLDRSLLPPITRVREGSVADTDLVDAVDRRLRGAGRGADVAAMLGYGARLLIADDSEARGYVFAKDGTVLLLGAGDEATAQRLLWSALATSRDSDQINVGFISGAQQWAFDVIVRARLEFAHEVGGLFVRGDPGPLQPYLPSGAYL